MTRDQRTVFERGLHALEALDDLVVLHADTPPIDRALDATAKCLREQLMAEADANKRALAVDRLEHELFDVLDPRLVVVHRKAARGAEPAIALVERRRQV